MDGKINQSILPMISTISRHITHKIEQIHKQSTTLFSLYNPNKQKSTRNLTDESGSFLFFQLFKQLIQQILNRCRFYYRDNKKELENIEYEYTSNEDEVLFDLSTVFKIKSMIYIHEEHYWKCSIFATMMKVDTIAKEYLEFKQKQLDNCDNIQITFSDLLFEMGQWFKCQNYLQQYPNNPYIYFGLADICCSTLRLYHDINNFNQAIVFAQILINLGLVYFDQGNDEASSDHLAFAHYHNGDYEAALICLLKSKYQEALEKFLRAADINQRSSTDSSERHIIVLNNIGKCKYLIGLTYLAMGDLNKAANYLEKARLICVNVLRQYHPDLVLVYQSINDLKSILNVS
ncbi:hypothetical protein I4U23_005785 [Adineta vaga]|nr:hypothetical protein I4U23_005785 [Adineta vaga]